MDLGRENRRRELDGDDSLLASVAGVPLTRMARVALCVIWAGFWAARVLLTAATAHISPVHAKLLLSELLGSGPVDQAFSICMIWLTIEVAAIIFTMVSGGIKMLIAKTPKSLKSSVLEGLTEGFTPEELEAIAARMRKARQEKAAKKNGQGG